mgnify:FL=1
MQYGLLGEHLTHSYSCEIHAGIADYNYELCEVPKDSLDDFMVCRDFKAINVTIPYKKSVIPYLDFISECAKRIGAVNTIVNNDGKLFGYNTDCLGMTEALGYAGIDIKEKKVLILGTGGTSKTAHAVAEDLGASEIVTVSRHEGNDAVTYECAVSRHGDAEIIINTTPVGMFPSTDGCPIDISAFPRLEGVFDAIYHPLRTNLVLDAAARGIPAIGGLYMLVAQAVYASALFLGKEARVDMIGNIYDRITAEKQNIALIGMPSSGKTTIGLQLSEKLGRELIDTDSIIVERVGMPISDIFAEYGEQEFRRLETEAIKEASDKSGVIIATGGGAVLNPLNTRALKRNSTVIFLDRPPECLLVTSDRPLSSSRTAIEKMFSERYEKYTGAADIRIDADATPESITDSLLKELKIG